MYFLGSTLQVRSWGIIHVVLLGVLRLNYRQVVEI